MQGALPSFPEQLSKAHPPNTSPGAGTGWGVLGSHIGIGEDTNMQGTAGSEWTSPAACRSHVPMLVTP